jgi:CheY-like chemotaxis protein
MADGVALPRRILVVDDNKETRWTLRLVLEDQGHSVEEADDGLDGVQKALALRPDVVLIDIDMPVFDGCGVARRLREAFGVDVRLVALTGHDHRERALAAGFDAHVLKPAALEELLRVVVGTDLEQK